MPIARPAVLLAAALALTTPHLSASSDVLLQADRQSNNCPVIVSVQPRFDDGISLIPDQAAGRTRAGVRLHLEDPDGRPIRSAEITVRGRAAIHGAQPASESTTTDASGPISHAFHVVTGATPGSLTATLWLAHASLVQSVTVTAIEYAAAPAWHTSPAASCIAVPNGSRLVGSLR